MKPIGLTPNHRGAWWRKPDSDNECVYSGRFREHQWSQDLVQEHLEATPDPLDDLNDCECTSCAGYGTYMDISTETYISLCANGHGYEGRLEGDE